MHFATCVFYLTVKLSVFEPTVAHRYLEAEEVNGYYSRFLGR
jgi:hypothetical protein